MAATRRPSKEQQERTRSAIQTTQLVKRLQNFALGEKDEAGNTVEIDSNRLRAIELLLKKALPDLSSISLLGDDENPINFVHRIERSLIRANADN